MAGERRRDEEKEGNAWHHHIMELVANQIVRPARAEPMTKRQAAREYG